MAKKTSINIKPAKVIKSEAHNERNVKLDYILPGFEGQHEHWKTDSISFRMEAIKELYRERVGQNMQPKSEPIREGIAVIKEDTTMNELRELGHKLKERFGIECFQIHIHRDEGHIVTEEEVKAAKALGGKTIELGKPIINHHAHLVFDWQDKKTGRSIKLNPADTREMQTITAQVLGMERGQSYSNATRLEAKEFKAFRQKLNESVAEELSRLEKIKSNAIQEVTAIEERKKKLLPGLRALESDMKTIGQSFRSFETNYDQTLKELNDSKEELKKLESKFALQNKLEALPWKACKDNNVQAWLAMTHGLYGIQIKKGQDGSIYFQLGETKARLKDMPADTQTVIKTKLSNDRSFNKVESIKPRMRIR